MGQAAARGGSVVEVDASEDAIAQARRASGLENCTFINGVAEAIDTPDGT
jgi:ubiquinone/menaquinone biosynthesis C-methylase UbiE